MVSMESAANKAKHGIDFVGAQELWSDPSRARLGGAHPPRRTGNECIAPTTVLVGTGPVMCRDRLGGVLKFYYREAT